MNVFFVKRENSTWHCQYRTTPLHVSVFAGATAANTIESSTVMEDDGSVVVNVSGDVRMVRSGKFVPSLFMQLSTTLILSETIKEQLKKLGAKVFTPVVFEKLVDIDMPPIGDDTWFQSVTYPPGPEPDFELFTRPDVPDFHKKIEDYYVLECPTIYGIRKKLPDIRRVTANFGSFRCEERERVLVSKRLLQDHPVIWDSSFVFREDAFAVIAPYLDLDYFSIARAQID
ncbi:hypothetical protein [Thalassoglobus sp.]|uniref:hypothetical protein n=1 Tax=Thalassoglobus sp. TaxID=2795869 RepID=UPI003AA8AFA4